jgi:ABC-2 type transport system permease protein
MKVHLAAAHAIFRRDLRIFFSYRSMMYSQAFAAASSIAIFYYLSRLLSVRSFESTDSYFAFVIVGLVILAVVQATFVLSTSVRSELVAGTFERVLLSPFGAVRGALSMMVFPTIHAIFMGAWTLLVAAVFFGLHLHWATVPLALPVAILAALAFSAIALLVAAVIVVFKQAPGVGMIMVGITFISGLYFPTNLLPAWIEWASEVQPFTPAVNLLRELLVDMPTSTSPWLSLLKLVAFTAVLLPFATWVFSRGVAMGQRRGTIIEY